VLETRTFRRVGGSADVTVDVRVVAATHRDLKKAVAEGRFREDLYFRLNVVPIVVPPLRERPEDIRALADHFVQHYCRELGRPVARIHADALRAMLAYRWPGNVRELKNVIERVLLLEAEEEIRLEHMPAEIHGQRAAAAGSDPFPAGVVRPLAEIEHMAIEHALAVCDRNKTRAAQLLGISRQTLRTKLKEFAPDADNEDGTENDETP
jgi:DNA-binding NtrC family response regulator